MKPVLLDTGPIVALLDSTDGFHSACTKAIANIGAPLITCEPVIAEACFLLRKVKDAPEVILDNVAAGVFQIPVPLASCAEQVRRILSKYRRRESDLADACLVHLANEFETGDILSLDLDFRFYRWGRSKVFRMLIPLS